MTAPKDARPTVTVQYSKNSKVLELVYPNVAMARSAYGRFLGYGVYKAELKNVDQTDTPPSARPLVG